jgi:hypothetical protein
MFQKLILTFLTISILSSSFIVKAQNNFDIIQDNKSERVKFKLINNLVILSVKLNNEKLNFIVDTGSKHSILFNVDINEAQKFKQTEKIKIKGLGGGEFIEALKSKNNLLRIGNLVCPNYTIYIILNQKFDFSSRLGININGIIGCDLFKDLVVDIDYNRKKIRFSKPETYRYNKCKKCITFPINIYRSRPYVNASIKDFKTKNHAVRLLIDSGSSDALWIYSKPDSKIELSDINFNDYLGKGLSGSIFGTRSKLTAFKMGKFIFKDVIIANPDSLSFLKGMLRDKRDGTLGGEILSRFRTIYDFKNHKITLKKNNSRYYRPFKYNKSGLEIIYFGDMLVVEKKASYSYGSIENNAPLIQVNYNYVFKNAYKIDYVKEGSPSDIVGLKKNDIILEINNIPIYHYSIPDIMQKFSDKNGKKVKIKIRRNGMNLIYTIVLKDLL